MDSLLLVIFVKSILCSNGACCVFCFDDTCIILLYCIYMYSISIICDMKCWFSFLKPPALRHASSETLNARLLIFRVKMR